MPNTYYIDYVNGSDANTGLGVWLRAYITGGTGSAPVVGETITGAVSGATGVLQYYTTTMDYAFLGQPFVSAVSAGAYTLDIGVGAYLVTGTNIDFVHNYVVTPDSGIYTLTGTAQNLLKGYVTPIGVGTYTLSGTAIDLLRGLYLNPDSGLYVETGIPVDLLKGWTLLPDSGAFILTGAAVDWFRNYVATVSPGSYLLTGSTVGLDKYIIVYPTWILLDTGELALRLFGRLYTLM